MLRICSCFVGALQFFEGGSGDGVFGGAVGEGDGVRGGESGLEGLNDRPVCRSF